LGLAGGEKRSSGLGLGPAQRKDAFELRSG
jgi:hypothetical protein